MPGDTPTSAGRAQLAAHVAMHEKDYEVIAQMRDADGSMLDRALDIVRQFIIERGLILFGGQAVDCALRLKGSQIYPNAQRPDFDFFSSRNVDDAYDLAEKLAGMGFASVGAIRAIHVQTMKVRVDSRWVADIGHVPLAVFNSIPTFEYQGMRVVHPDFQRMDMHLAFCFPFNGAPREDVFHRWRKDLRRINQYEKYYPLIPRDDPSHGLAARLEGPARTSDAILAHVRAATPIVALDSVLATAPLTPDLNIALHGFAAYALLRDALDTLSVESDAPRVAITFPDAYTVELKLPSELAKIDSTIIFASSRPTEITSNSDIKWSDPYIDVYPESVRKGPIVVLSTEGRLLAASRFRVSVAGSTINGEVRIVTPQYLLLWFLCEAHRAETAALRVVYRSYYVHTLSILRDAEAVFSTRISREIGTTTAIDEFAASPFAPSITTIGSINTDNTYIIKMADNAEKARESLPTALGVRVDASDLIRGLPPRGYYPGNGKPRPVFDYDACILFRRGGLPR